MTPKPSINKYSLNDLAGLCQFRQGQRTLSPKEIRYLGYSYCLRNTTPKKTNKCQNICAQWVSFDKELIKLLKTKFKVTYHDILPLHKNLKKGIITDNKSMSPIIITQASLGKSP